MLPEIKHKLARMEFDELRKLIDYCLSNLDAIDNKNLVFVTKDTDKISEYIDVLESRLNKPIYSPPKFSPPTFTELKTIPALQLKSATDLERESKQIIIDKEKQIFDIENQYKQKITNLGDWLFILKNQRTTLEKELDKFQQKQNHFNKTKNEDEKDESKMQCLKQESVELEKIKIEKEFLAKIKNVKKQLTEIKTKTEVLENALKIDKKQRDYFLKKEKANLSYTIKKQINRNFKAEARSLKKLAKKKVEKYKKCLENQKKRTERSYSIKVTQYDESYQLELKDYDMSFGGKIIKRLRSDILKLNEYKISAKKLNWELLPTSEISFNQIERYLRKLSKFKDNGFDCEKINKIVSLKADEIYCGTNQFEGYLVFYFRGIKIAILDCPRKGNAIYIFGEDWKNLSRLSKFDLLNHHSDKTKRIIHRGDWFERLQSYIKTR